MGWAESMAIHLGFLEIKTVAANGLAWVSQLQYFRITLLLH
jgi:hypothetical protein